MIRIVKIIYPMQVLRPYILPIKGLKPGTHEYTYQVNDEFFAAFPDSPVKKAALELSILVDKKFGEFTVRFDFEGTMATECDRCLAGIDLPVSGTEVLLFQINPDGEEESDDPLLVYLAPDAHELELATYAYEFMLLAMPMIRTFDCRTGQPPYPCDEEMLDKLDAEEEALANRNRQEDTDKPSPWDVLKNLNKD
ncbi:hypothetical protein CEQ90_14015 [Lewinellaceae bacterium SD302]|nr:hypothetical protein CEQ90_14015 [Lewinellaceae bacterium SD302]